MRRLCQWIVVLMLGGCASLHPESTPRTTPPLDSRLAEHCAPLSKPQAADYDAWLDWLLDVVLPAYGDCAARHRETVAAWPK